MYCGQCGEKSVDTAKFCGKCGASLQSKNVTLEKETVAQEERASRVIEPKEEPSKVTRSGIKSPVYAGFWLRTGALLIDTVMIAIVSFILGFIFAIPTVGTYIEYLASTFANLIVAVLAILYVGFTESSKMQGTVGKKLVGIKVVDLHGNRISFGRAIGRHMAKVLSFLIIYVGFMMAGFTERKQALHDMIAGCLVIRKQPDVSYNRSHEQSF